MLQLVRPHGGQGSPFIIGTHLKAALAVLTDRDDGVFGANILMAHETEALLRVLEARVYTDDQVEGLTWFLRLVDPLKDGGWNDAQLEAYIASATASLSQPLWLTRAFEHLDRVRVQVAYKSGRRLFRIMLLRAAIAYFDTRFPPEEVEPIHATG